MSMLRTMIGMSVFMVLLNIVAYAFAQTLPGNVIALNTLNPDIQGFARYEQNAQVSVDPTNIAGFIVDAASAVGHLNQLVGILFGGSTITTLLHLPSEMATYINIVQGVIYVITLFLFFSGRSD